jgi:hypothetical protein
MQDVAVAISAETGCFCGSPEQMSTAMLSRVQMALA